MERHIYSRVELIVELIVDPLLTQKQDGTRHGRSTVDQITRVLIQEIVNWILTKNKPCAVFIDLTAANKR